METVKINTIKVKVRKDCEDKRPYKYDKLFSHAFPNIFLAARKNSGKTVLIQNILDMVVDKKWTVVRIFS